MPGPITKDATTWALGLMQIRVGACAANIANINPILTQAHSLGALANTKYLGNVEYFIQESGFPKTEDGVIPLREKAALECAFKEITPYNLALARGIDPSASVAAHIAMGSYIDTIAGTTTGVIAVGANPVDQEITCWKSAEGGEFELYSDLTGPIGTYTGSQLTNASFVIPASFFTGTWLMNHIYRFHVLAGGSSAYSNVHAGSIGLGGMAAPVNVRVEAVYTFPDRVHTMTFVLPRAQVVANMEVDFSEEDAAAVPITLESKNASSANTSGSSVWDTMPLGRVIFA